MSILYSFILELLFSSYSNFGCKYIDSLSNINKHTNLFLSANSKNFKPKSLVFPIDSLFYYIYLLRVAAPHQKPPSFCKLNVENPPNKNIFCQIPNCNLRPYKIALIESLPLKNIATLFVYSEILLIFAAKSINNWLMTTFALNNLWNYLQGLSLSQSDREWLANKLIMPKDANATEDDNARFWRYCRLDVYSRRAPSGCRNG